MKHHQTINFASASLHGLQSVKPRARAYKVRDPYRKGDRQVVVVYSSDIAAYGTSLDSALALWRRFFHQRQTTGTIPWSNTTDD